MQAALPKTEFIIKIVQITDHWLKWSIPCFPVLSLEFNKVTFQFNNTEFPGLIVRGQSSHIGKMKCKTHCNIEIDGEAFTVLWEPKRQNDNLLENPVVSDGEGVGDEFHSLPFKVLGTCYDESRQKALEAAHECMYEHNRHVSAKLELEPENTHDENAIAVYVSCPSEPHYKVGYIDRHLTQYVKPCLGTYFQVTIRNIRFSTKFQLIGFYICIVLTKKGAWPNPVVKASKSVR